MYNMCHRPSHVATFGWLNGAEAAAAAGGSSPDNAPKPGTTPRARLPARRDPNDPDDGRDVEERLLPDFFWDPTDVLLSYSALLFVLCAGATPWAAGQRFGYVPYFTALASVSIYVGAHRGLVREDRETFSLEQSAAVPVACSASLLAVYLVLKYTEVDLAALVGGYFWLLGSVAVTSNLMLPIGAAGGEAWSERELVSVPIPEGLAVDKETGEPVTQVPLTAAVAAAGAIGIAAATADLVLGHGNHTVNNFLACCIVADFLSLIGLGSFAAAGTLLAGLLLYDAFWVFGSGYVFGDGTMDSNVMMTVATSESFQGPFRLIFPRFDDVLNPPPPGVPPYSLLGLGDVAVPGLLACLALRYDASRATDMRGRATAAAAAFMGAFDDAWSEADVEAELASGVVGSRAEVLGDEVAEKAAAAAEAAFDAAADVLGDTTSGATLEGGNTGGQNMMVPRSMGGRAFFSSVMVGYVGGLLLACGVNLVTGTGQPALVYLVPATLGSVLLTAGNRGEFGRLMAYKEPEK